MNLVVYRPTISHGEFQREATLFCALQDDDNLALALEGTTVQRRRAFAGACQSLAGQGVERFAYFGHGPARGLSRFHSNDTVGDMAVCLALCLAPDAEVVLYACLTGRGYGFADRLAVALSQRGLDRVRVVSHLLRGHTTRAPYAEWSGADGGRPIMYRRDPLWGAWVEALQTRFRFEYPFLTIDEIKSHLRGDEPRRCPERGQVITDE